MLELNEREFKVQLGERFFLPSVSLEMEDIPELLNISLKTLKEIYTKGVINNFTQYKLKGCNEVVNIYANWEDIEFDFNIKQELTVRLTLEGENNYSSDYITNYLSHFLELYLYEWFLVSNISIPGIISLYSTKYIVTGYTKKIVTDNFFFANSLEWSREYNWPTIEYIPIDMVLAWYKSLNIGTRQIAQNTVERVIFAVLHVCNEEISSPSGLIWLAHAIESLFSSNNGQINKTIINRIYLTLSEPPNNKRKIKKIFQDFYELRSRFVHGDFNIHHPAQNEILDGSYSAYVKNFTETYTYIFTIILSTLQMLIKNGWIGFDFIETYKGDEII